MIDLLIPHTTRDGKEILSIRHLTHLSGEWAKTPILAEVKYNTGLVKPYFYTLDGLYNVTHDEESGLDLIPKIRKEYVIEAYAAFYQTTQIRVTAYSDQEAKEAAHDVAEHGMDELEWTSDHEYIESLSILNIDGKLV